MIDKVSVNADRIRQYEYEHGPMEVERFLDAVLAIEEHIDPNFHIRPDSAAEERRDDDAAKRDAARSPYEDLWSLSDREKSRRSNEEPARSPRRRFPPRPEKICCSFWPSMPPVWRTGSATSC